MGSRVRRLFALPHNEGEAPARVVDALPRECVHCNGRVEPYEGDPGGFCTECGQAYEYDDESEATP